LNLLKKLKMIYRINLLIILIALFLKLTNILSKLLFIYYKNKNAIHLFLNILNKIKISYNLHKKLNYLQISKLQNIMIKQRFLRSEVKLIGFNLKLKKKYYFKINN